MLIEPQAARVDWEDAVIQRAVRGDKRAFEQIYHAHSGRVHALCLRMTCDAAMAEDCTQETFINAWRALKTFGTRSSLSTWLHRVAVNVVLARRRRISISVADPPDVVEEAEQSWTFDTPIEIEEIEAALGCLPLGARDVLILSGIYGYSHREVSQMLGIAASIATLQKAKRDLEDALGKDPGNALLQELLVNTYQDEMRVLTAVQQAGSPGGGI